MLVLINEHHGDAKTQAYLLEFDSVHGTWDRRCTESEDGQFVEIARVKAGDDDKYRVAFSGFSDPTEVAWMSSEA